MRLRPASLAILLAGMTIFPAASLPLAQAQDKSQAAVAASDPILHAMQMEMARSQAQLKMDNIGEPFYIEYRVFDVDQFEADAAFGATQEQSRSQLRLLRATVRLGNYKVDSFYGPGTGISDIVPLDNDEMALRHQIWMATDEAYKRAGEALSSKQSMLSQLSVDQPVDDFAKAAPVQSIGAPAKLDVGDPSKWTKMLESATAVYKMDPKIQSMTSNLSFIAVTSYFINTEGTVTRQGSVHYRISLAASEQAADGMRLDRDPAYSTTRVDELPTSEQLTADAAKLLDNMKKLREAPIVEEEYRGPVLFSNDASNDVIMALIMPNLLGRKPAPGRPARTTGAFASSYKARVLPDFISIVDDPTMDSFNGHSLGGSYKVDDEGVPVAPLTVVDNGQLVNFLIGRLPIRDLPVSNGHGRAGGNGTTGPAPGNLFVKASKTSSFGDLKKQLIQICQDRGLPYGYFVDTMGGPLSPRVLYRIWVKDGRQEMERGALFNELDTRALRSDLLAAGDDPLVSNRAGIPFTTVVSPSLLIDDLEVKRADNSNEKLPDYPPPALSAAAN